MSHDLEEALKIGSHISIVENGRIVQTGRPEDIILHPVNDYVRDFVTNVNFLSVLTANNIMHRIDELEQDMQHWIWLDPHKTARFKLGKNNQVVAIERNGQVANWIPCIKAKSNLANKRSLIFWTNPSTVLKTVLLAFQSDDTVPVVLLNENHTFAGVICAIDLLSLMSNNRSVAKTKI